MSKYMKYRYQQVKERRWKIHPIWRGFGFLLIILVPCMSFAGAILLVRQNFQHGWVRVPAELLRSFTLPELGSISPELTRIYYLDIALAVVMIVLGFGVISILYSFIYSLLAPSRYGPVDSPPIRKSPRKTPR